MSKVTLKPGNRRALSNIANSDVVAAQIRPLAEAIFQAAKSDPNPRYVSLLTIEEHHSRGPRGRVSYRVGCRIPQLGRRVEAKRGTLARAMGASGA